MIAAGFGMMFTMFSVMPAKAYGPRNGNSYGTRDRGRTEMRDNRRDFRDSRGEMRDNRRDVRDDKREGARGERFDRHKDYHQEYRGYR